jgi:hypothetical protein
MPKSFNRGVKVNDASAGEGFQLLDNPLYPQVNVRTATVTAKTTDYTVVVSDLNKVFTNAAAGGTVVFTLPSVAGNAGKALKFHSLAAQIIRLLPATGQAVNLHGSAVVTKYLNVAAVIGNYVDVYCDGYQWIVTGYAGVVTKEA